MGVQAILLKLLPEVLLTILVRVLRQVASKNLAYPTVVFVVRSTWQTLDNEFPGEFSLLESYIIRPLFVCDCMMRGQGKQNFD